MVLKRSGKYNEWKCSNCGMVVKIPLRGLDEEQEGDRGGRALGLLAFLLFAAMAAAIFYFVVIGWE